MGLPEAYICHLSPQRLRVKIASRKGNAEYFDKLRAKLAHFQSLEHVEVNPLTGSVLIVAEHVDADAIAKHCKTQRLFDLTDQNNSRPPMTTHLVSHLKGLETSVQKLSSGGIDLAGILLLGLLISGIAGLLRGDIRMPPWYTAFWYAFGVYKVASVVKENKIEDAQPG
jgi:hypothetical protein